VPESGSSPVILTWNAANWFTIVLMVSLMYFIVGAVVRILRQRRNQKAAA
jgi:uncharacterized membrane protein SirB2